MKKNRIDKLDIDFIGDQEQPITAVEQKVISEYFQKQKIATSEILKKDRKKLSL